MPYQIYKKFKKYPLRKFIIYSFIEVYRLLMFRSRGSFAQHGEDLLMQPWLPSGTDWAFIDVGCNDPVRFNNTYMMYRKGLRGINVDANPECIKQYARVRPDDINIAAGVSDKQGTLPFYVRAPDVSSSFIKDHLEGSEILEVLPIELTSLECILDKHLGGRKLGLLNCDAEGLDLEVIKSNNWDKYRPSVICAEGVAVSKYLQDLGYVCVGMTALNGIWVDLGVKG